MGFNPTTRSRKDIDSSVVLVVVRVSKTRKDKPLRTANFYNTSSKLLVNGLGSNVELFLDHLIHHRQHFIICSLRVKSEHTRLVKKFATVDTAFFNTSPIHTITLN